MYREFCSTRCEHAIFYYTRCGTQCENVNSPPLYYDLYILVLIFPSAYYKYY